jgi:hypothetical protein
MDENIKITIEGVGLSLIKHTTLQKAGQIISFLGYSQDGPISATNSNSGVGAPLLPNKRLQPKEIIESSNAKTYAQKITAIAVYFKEQLGQSIFTPQEFKIQFKKMGDEPKNFTRDINTALSFQYIHCTDTVTEQYELTDKGENAVRDGFTGAVVKKNLRTKKTSVSKSIRDEVKSMEISGDMEGFPDYSSLSTKGDKILWLLAYADKKEVSTLSPGEVDYLSQRLRDCVESSGFTALNGKNIKNSFVKKTALGFQIQKRGYEYLKKINTKE